VSLGPALIFRWTDIPLHWLTTGLAVHVIWTLPFSLVVFLMFFNRFDSSLEDAALTLGATRWQTFRHVTLPLMQPAVLTSFLFCFTLSLDEFQRSLLITGHEQTLPLMVMASVTTRITPTLYALGTMTTLLSFAAVAAYLVLMTYLLRKRQQ
jgi:putative spermidine/putrescine transport system permease protein